MSLHDDICEALRVHVLPPDLGAVKVTGWDEDSYDLGGCETCGSDTEYEVWISYVNAAGKHSTHLYNGKFSELISKLS